MMGHKSAKMTLDIYDQPSIDNLVRTIRNFHLLGSSTGRSKKGIEISRIR